MRCNGCGRPMERREGEFVAVEHCPGCGKDVPAGPLRHPATERFHEIVCGIAELADQKGEDYGRDDDPFANVRAGGEEWGIAPWVAAMVRATDKVRRLQTYARKGTLANEGVVDAFRDLAVYALIGLVLYEQDQEDSPDA